LIIAVPIARRAQARAGLALALVLLALIAAVSAYQAARLADEAVFARQAWSVDERLTALERRMVEVTAGLRGYLITDDESLLAPLEGADDFVAAALGALRPDIVDASQLRRVADLAPMLESRLATVRELVRLRRDQDTAAAVAGFAASRREHERVVSAFAAIRYEQGTIRAAREREAVRRARLTGAVVLAGGALAFASLMLALYSMHRGAIERQQLEQAKFEAERALRVMANQLTRLHAMSLDVICELDAEGRFQSVSPACEAIWGYLPEELLGTPYSDKVLPEDRPKSAAAAQAVVAGQPLVSFTNRYVHKNGSIVPMLWSAQWSHAEQLMIAIGHDITERERLAAGLERQAATLRQTVTELEVARNRAEAADRLKSAFLATMSHELRTPLNSIIGFTGLLLQKLPGPLTAEQTRQLEMVRASGRHLLALINDVLDISKLEAGQLAIHSEPVDVRAAIGKVTGIVRPLAEQKGLVLTVEIAPSVGTVPADGRRLEQVLLNLLSNAIKFTPQGAVSVTARVDAGSLQVAILDTGIGIRPEDLQELFRPFHQIDTGLARAHEGTGLGLAISRRLAQLMGGDIAAESEPGKGSRFTLRLPLSHGMPA
jgi:PAS domain S-box-containing protein